MTNKAGFSLALASAVGLFVASGVLQAAVHAAPNNVVVDWNRNMLAAFATANVPPPAANRMGAIVQSAVFDAVNGIERRYTAIHVQPAGPEEASPQAAAVAASHTTLVALFPGQKANLDALFASSIQLLSDDEDMQAIDDGIAWGTSVGDQIVAWRSTDGFSATPPAYTFSTAPYQWQPTPPGIGPPKFRTLATTTPFALTSPSQFRPSGPPALTSARYTESFNEVKALGALNSTTRTAFQTQTAVFWQVDTVVAQWDRVADDLVVENHKNVLQSARILALTNLSIADTIIAVFDAKNAYNSWRPVTAIVHADEDGNPATTPDPTWLPLLVTPYFQEYPSAHSAVSSAAATTLASLFGEETTFTVTSLGLPGVQREFTTFNDAVNQVADARVFAGFHFRFSCDDGITLGAEVASYVQSKVIQPAGE